MYGRPRYVFLSLSFFLSLSLPRLSFLPFVRGSRLFNAPTKRAPCSPHRVCQPTCYEPRSVLKGLGLAFSITSIFGSEVSIHRFDKRSFWFFFDSHVAVRRRQASTRITRITRRVAKKQGERKDLGGPRDSYLGITCFFVHSVRASYLLHSLHAFRTEYKNKSPRLTTRRRICISGFVYFQPTIHPYAYAPFVDWEQLPTQRNAAEQIRNQDVTDKFTYQSKYNPNGYGCFRARAVRRRRLYPAAPLILILGRGWQRRRVPRRRLLARVRSLASRL